MTSFSSFPRRVKLAGCSLAVAWLTVGMPFPSLAEEGSPAPDGVVRYSRFGAKGDGKTDDSEAIMKAHRYANEHDLPVKAEDDATYYIGGKKRTAVIQTDTDFGKAKFIIDDTAVEHRTSHVFSVESKQRPFRIKGISTLKQNQEKIEVSLPGPCLVVAMDASVKRFIRFGRNQNNGASQTDIFLVDADGTVHADTPIIWDFDQITQITAYPIDEETLTIRGGHFTTIANRVESNPAYYARGIKIQRSHVTVDGMEHHVTGEGELGAPYSGFISVSHCAHVTVKNTTLTGRKTSRTIGADGALFSRGTYDITVTRASHVSFEHCSQANDINDRTYWGIMGSNYGKNLSFDHCTFSRFDAHMGVHNATIRNSTLGHQGINAIGTGTFTVENSTIQGRSFINLRSDYGSTWQGEFIIKDCVFLPSAGNPASASVIGGANSGQHDFGYTCHMPWRITITGLHIDDSNHPANYQGPAIFANFNRNQKNASYKELFPYIKTKEVILKNVTTTTGKPWRLSDNKFLFREVKVTNVPGE